MTTLYPTAAWVARGFLRAATWSQDRHIIWRFAGTLAYAREGLARLFQYRIPPVVCATIQGRQLLLSGTPWTGVAAGVFWGGEPGFEPNETALVASLSRNYRVAFDIGANVGWFTLVMLSHNPMLQVLAFEPNPAIADCLEENLRLNKCTATIDRRAISDGEGTVEFHIGRDDWSSSLLSGGDADTKILVDTVSIDTLVQSNGSVPDLIKIDIEGNEEKALGGARETMKDYGPDILCEISPKVTNLNVIKAILRDTGYETAWTFDGATRIVEDPALEKAAGRTIINYFFTRQQNRLLPFTSRRQYRQ